MNVRQRCHLIFGKYGLYSGRNLEKMAMYFFYNEKSLRGAIPAQRVLFVASSDLPFLPTRGVTIQMKASRRWWGNEFER